MKISKDARKLAKQLFQSSFTNGKLDQNKARALVQSVIKSKPRNYIATLKHYQRLVRLEVDKRHAVVESAVPLDATTTDRVNADLRNRYGFDLTTAFTVNPALIGGLRIRIGDDVWDGSLRDRLARLEHDLAA